MLSLLVTSLIEQIIRRMRNYVHITLSTLVLAREYLNHHPIVSLFDDSALITLSSRPELHPNADFGICILNALNIKRGYWRSFNQIPSNNSAGVSPMGSTPGSAAYASSAAGRSGSISGAVSGSSSHQSGSRISAGPLRDSPNSIQPSQPYDTNGPMGLASLMPNAPWFSRSLDQSGQVNTEQYQQQQGATIDNVTPPADKSGLVEGAGGLTNEAVSLFTGAANANGPKGGHFPAWVMQNGSVDR